MDITQDEWMDPLEIGSRKRTVGPGEITETGLVWHTTRKYESLEKEVVQGCTPGNRTSGRQRRCWTDDIIEWTGLTINEAAGSTGSLEANPSLGRGHWTTMMMKPKSLLLHKSGTIYLLLSEDHHHLTPSNVTSKLTTLPHQNTHQLATPPHLRFNFF